MAVASVCAKAGKNPVLLQEEALPQPKYTRIPRDFNKFERKLVTGNSASHIEPHQNIGTAIRKMAGKYSYINYGLIGKGGNEQGGWPPFEFSKRNIKPAVVFTTPAYSELNKIRPKAQIIWKLHLFAVNLNI